MKKWQSSFENYMLKESEVLDALKTCEIYHKKILEFKTHLKRYIFSDKIITFNPNQNVNESIGDIFCTPTTYK